MLFLSRKKDEVIMIGNNVKLTVKCINKKQVLLGFEAPTDIEIYREEIYKKIHGDIDNEKPKKINKFVR